jgi:hypothetical protein
MSAMRICPQSLGHPERWSIRGAFEVREGALELVGERLSQLLCFGQGEPAEGLSRAGDDAGGKAGPQCHSAS